jgi:hypothetical protein
MPDYAAAPIQPIVEGLVTFPGGVGTQPFFDGKGVSSIVRDPATGGQGGYILTLDVGLPGNAGAVPFAASPLEPPLPVFAPDPDVRTLVIPLGVGIPPLSGIASIGVSYISSALTGVGAPQIEVVLTNAVFIPHDPKGGFQIIVWIGIGGGPVP